MHAYIMYKSTMIGIYCIHVVGMRGMEDVMFSSLGYK